MKYFILFAMFFCSNAAFAQFTGGGDVPNGLRDVLCQKDAIAAVKAKFPKAERTKVKILKIKVVDRLEGYCDGETCNPDSRFFYIRTESRLKEEYFIVSTTGPVRKMNECEIEFVHKIEKI